MQSRSDDRHPPLIAQALAAPSAPARGRPGETAPAPGAVPPLATALPEPPLPLRVQGLTAGYNRRPAIEDLSFTVARGELVGLIGPNGAGKSTLIKALIGLLRPWRGRIELLGRAPRQARPRLGYMPQVEAVDWNFPATVREVVKMGGYRRQWGLRRIRDLLDGSSDDVGRALARMRIAHLAARPIGELSGGEQRRVLLARALLRDPDLLLLDEPTAGLDVTAEETLQALFLELQREGKTLIVATHDITAVRAAYSMVLCLNRRLVAAGPPRAVMTERVLVDTFGRHLVVFHEGEHGYAAEPHVHHGVHQH